MIGHRLGRAVPIVRMDSYRTGVAVTGYATWQCARISAGVLT